MEHPTQFDLNNAIQSWRAQISRQEAIGRENAEELESHLRDSIDSLQSRGGLSSEESFLVASRRMGSGSALTAEFGKVNAKEVFMTRLFWMLIGVLGWGLFTSVTHLMVYNRIAFACIDSCAHFFSAWGVPISPVVFCFLLHVLAALAMAGMCWAPIALTQARFRGRLVGFLQHRAVLALVCMILLRFLCMFTMTFEVKTASRSFVDRHMSREVLARTFPSALNNLALASQYSEPLLMISLTVFAVVLARKRAKAEKRLAAAE